MTKTIQRFSSRLGIAMALSGMILACSVQSPPTSSDPGKAENVYKQGLEKIKKRDFKGAIEDFDRAVQLNPQYAEAYNNRGNTYFVLGNQQEAMKNYNQALKLNPELASAYYNRGYANYKGGKMEQAIKDYNRAIELNPKYLPAYGIERSFALNLEMSKGLLRIIPKSCNLSLTCLKSTIIVVLLVLD